MGYAIIKGGAKAYALNRQVQNLTPVDSKYRKNLVSDVTATYDNGANGIYKVTDINLGNATQPYIYALVDSSGNDKAYTGVSINTFSGAITTTSGYTGEAVYVKVKPQIVANYYTTAASTSAFLAIAQHSVTHTASLDSFIYIIDGGTGWPQGLPSSETTLTLTLLNITYDGNAVVLDNLNTIPSVLTNYSVTALVGSTNVAKSTSTLKSLTIVKNTSTNDRSVKITINAKYNGCSISSSHTIPQAGSPSETVTNISVDDLTLTELSSIENIKATTNLDTEVDVTVTPDVVLPGTNTYTAQYNGINDTFTITSSNITNKLAGKAITLDSSKYDVEASINPAISALSDSSAWTNNTYYVGSGSTSAFRKSWVITGTLKKYYYLETNDSSSSTKKLNAIVINGDSVPTTSSGNQASFIAGERVFIEDEFITQPNVLFVFNPSTSNTLIVSLIDDNVPANTEYKLKEITFK